MKHRKELLQILFMTAPAAAERIKKYAEREKDRFLLSELRI